MVDFKAICNGSIVCRGLHSFSMWWDHQAAPGGYYLHVRWPRGDLIRVTPKGPVGDLAIHVCATFVNSVNYVYSCSIPRHKSLFPVKVFLQQAEERPWLKRSNIKPSVRTLLWVIITYIPHFQRRNWKATQLPGVKWWLHSLIRPAITKVLDFVSRQLGRNINILVIIYVVENTAPLTDTYKRRDGVWACPVSHVSISNSLQLMQAYLFNKINTGSYVIM
jgi:hypothetical protein